MGGARDKVPAYASTYPNIGKPYVYAEHALACKAEGYRAYKIHPHYFWNPDTGQPTNGRPSNIRADIETINLVREAVGSDMVLMYDVWGTYHTIEEAIKVGRELERLDFYWYEHPMPEYRVESYRRLCRELSIPVLAPEIAAGGVFTRAEWILQGASDMSRMDIRRGGVTGCRCLTWPIDVRGSCSCKRVAKKNTTRLTQQSGLNLPIRWSTMAFAVSICSVLD